MKILWYLKMSVTIWESTWRNILRRLQSYVSKEPFERYKATTQIAKEEILRAIILATRYFYFIKEDCGLFARRSSGSLDSGIQGLQVSVRFGSTGLCVLRAGRGLPLWERLTEPLQPMWTGAAL